MGAPVLLPCTPALAETLPFYERTADGTWDCTDPAETFVGTVVLADEAYAFIRADGTLAGYGKLYRISADTHLPSFAVLGGPLRDEFHSTAIALSGPRGNHEAFAGEVFLHIPVTPDAAREKAWYCAGRRAPAL
jgi:hypothetical protein